MENAETPPIAEEYLKDGYRIVARPEGRMPDFLAGFEPDFLAQKAGDNAVVKVISREELRRRESHWVYWIGKVNSQPEWHFDLVIADPSPWIDRVTSDASEFEIRDVRERLMEARRLLSEGHIEPACLFASALVEASSRLLARCLEIALANNDPFYVVKQLCADGAISSADHERLRRFLTVRNSVAHGMRTSGLAEGEIDGVMAITERFLSIAERKHRLAGA